MASSSKFGAGLQWLQMGQKVEKNNPYGKITSCGWTRCFRWGTLVFWVFLSIFLCCSSKPWRSFASERLNIQNNSVPRQKAAPRTPQVPKNAKDLVTHMALLTYLQKYLQVLYYSCHTANGAGLQSWLFPRCHLVKYHAQWQPLAF